MYKKYTNEYGAEIIERENEDGSVSWIPADESNSDYQQYLIDTYGGLAEPELPTS